MLPYIKKGECVKLKATMRSDICIGAANKYPSVFNIWVQKALYATVGYNIKLPSTQSTKLSIQCSFLPVNTILSHG